MPQAAWRVYALRSGCAELYRDSFFILVAMAQRVTNDPESVTFILMVALLDGPAVPAVGVPHLGAVPSPAVPAFYPAGEDARAACTVLPGMPGRHLVLRPPSNTDGLMMAWWLFSTSYCDTSPSFTGEVPHLPLPLPGLFHPQKPRLIIMIGLYVIPQKSRTCA